MAFLAKEWTRLFVRNLLIYRTNARSSAACGWHEGKTAQKLFRVHQLEVTRLWRHRSIFLQCFQEINGASFGAVNIFLVERKGSNNVTTVTGTVVMGLAAVAVAKATMMTTT